MFSPAVAFLFLLAAVPGTPDAVIPAPGRMRRVPALASAGALPDVASRRVLAKFSSPISAGLPAQLRGAGWSLETVLSKDSAVLRAGPAPSPVAAIAALAPLEPEDKAPAELLSHAGRIPARISVLGHPGSTAAGLGLEAAGAGLRALAGRESPFGARIELAPGADPARLRELLAADDVFAALPRPVPRLANDRSIGTIQSGVALGPTPIFSHGVYGATQTIGVLDTGLDVDSCYFADPSSPFVVNTYSGGVYGTRVGDAHRKIAAYDFLDSCDQFPAPCDDPSDPFSYDDFGHGTHAAGNAVGDNLAHVLLHDPGDGMAPGARLVVQDAGYAPDSKECGELPGLGCADGGLAAIFEQAYEQGVRIHSDSWSDDPTGPAPENSGYSVTARDVDDFVFLHPDFLPFFVAGNAGATGPRSVPSPGNGKNAVCVGSTRNTPAGSDEDLSEFSGVGPAADGRWKPDLVAPGVNVSASSDLSILTDNCTKAAGAGTSFSTPTAAGAGALVRDYFVQGFYPGGAANRADAFSPSAALVKAALIASAVPLAGTRFGIPVAVPPSNEQGFGRIDLGKVLAFSDSAIRVFVVDRPSAFRPGDSLPVLFHVTVTSSSKPLRAVLVWTDPPGVPRAYSDPTPELVDDLDLSVVGPGGATSSADRLNNVETVELASPAAGDYTISVVPHLVPIGPPVGFALVVAGEVVGETGVGLFEVPDSAALSTGPLQSCQDSFASVRIGNARGSPSSADDAVSIESLDSAVEITTPMPLALPRIPAGESVTVDFRLRSGSAGIPLPCGADVPFRATILANGGPSTSWDFSLPAAAGPEGCGTVGSLTCAPSQVRPIRRP